MIDLAQIAQVIIYADWSTKKTAAETKNLIATIKEIQPWFEKDFQFVWTDSEYALSHRHTFGIHWNELPALAVNPMQNFKHAFEEHQPLEKDFIVRWLGTVIKKKFNANYEPEALQSVNTINDRKIYKKYLKSTI